MPRPTKTDQTRAAAEIFLRMLRCATPERLWKDRRMYTTIPLHHDAARWLEANGYLIPDERPGLDATEHVWIPTDSACAMLGIRPAAIAY